MHELMENDEINDRIRKMLDRAFHPNTLACEGNHHHHHHPGPSFPPPSPLMEEHEEKIGNKNVDVTIARPSGRRRPDGISDFTLRFPTHLHPHSPTCC